MPRDVGRYLSRDPVFDHLTQQMDDLVERMFRRTPASYRRAWAPRVDVYETETEFVAVAELAGIDPAGVTIEIEGDQVTISGERNPAAPPEGAATLQLEIPFGSFERRLVLPCSVDTNGAKAGFTDGVLTVRLPKTRRGPTRVQVDIQPE